MTINDVLQYQLADRVPLFYLWRAVIRFCYDPSSCAFSHEIEMKKEIYKWNKFVEYQQKIKFEKFGQRDGDGTFIGEMERQLKIMSSVIVFSETGIWHSTDIDRPFALATVKAHKLDYRKLPMFIQFFPEAITKEGKEQGQKALEENMKENPEDYKNTGG